MDTSTCCICGDRTNTESARFMHHASTVSSQEETRWEVTMRVARARVLSMSYTTATSLARGCKSRIAGIARAVGTRMSAAEQDFLARMICIITCTANSKSLQTLTTKPPLERSKSHARRIFIIRTVSSEERAESI